jgi:hypothetical protein
MFLRISSLGAVAISISKGVMRGGVLSLGTKRMIVPCEFLSSAERRSFHFFDF